MNEILRIDGRLAATGLVVHEQRPENVSIYDYLRFVGENGQETYLERVFVPGYLDSRIGAGFMGRFYLVTLHYPQLFGSKPSSFLFGVVSAGQLWDGIQPVRKCFGLTKMGVVQLFIGGLVLLVAWGFGLLFWIQAIRLIRLELPMNKMREALKAES